MARRPDVYDDYGNVLPCDGRIAGVRRCGEPLAEDGTCWACETEACQACYDVFPAGVLVPVTDQGKTLHCCPACRGPEEAATTRTAIDAMSLGIAAAFLPSVEEAAHLLNGVGAHPDDEDEETREVPPLPAADLEAERRRGPAPLTDVEAYERGRQERERELATEQESGKGAAA